jgi:hypothetical protein
VKSLEDLLTELKVTALCRVCHARAGSVSRDIARAVLLSQGNLDEALSQLVDGKSLVQRIVRSLKRFFGVATVRAVGRGPLEGGR